MTCCIAHACTRRTRAQVARDLDRRLVMNRSTVTTDHDEIRRWAKARGGTPAAVRGTSRGKHDVGMIRIDFPGYSGEGTLEPISWDAWFEKFDESNLAMILQEETAKGAKSNFNKLVARESVDIEESGRGSRTKRAHRSRTQARGGQATRRTSRSTTSHGTRTAASKRAPRSRPGGAAKGASKRSSSRSSSRQSR